MTALVVHEAVSEGEALVLAFEGELDIETEDAFETLIAGAFETGVRKLTLDVSAVTFIDSSGLTSLVTALRAAQTAGATLSLRGPTRQLRDLLVMTGLETLFVIEA